MHNAELTEGYMCTENCMGLAAVFHTGEPP